MDGLSLGTDILQLNYAREISTGNFLPSHLHPTHHRRRLL